MTKSKSATVRVRWDAAQITNEDAMKLLTHAGMQIGIGESRPGSRNSYGLFSEVR